MSKSMALKFLAVLLCAVSLTSVAFSVLGITALASFDLYDSTPEEYQQTRNTWIADDMAVFVTDRYNLIHLSQVPDELAEHPWLYSSSYYDNYELLQNGIAFYTLCDDQATVLESNISQLSKWGLTTSDLSSYTIALSPGYPVLERLYLDENGDLLTTTPENTNTSAPYETTAPVDTTTEITPESLPSTEDSTQTAPTVADPEDNTTAPLDDELLYSDVWNLGDDEYYHVDYYQGPAYTVLVWLTDDAWSWSSSQLWETMELLYPYRNQLILWAAVALLIFITTLVYLGWAAGRKPGYDEIVPGGLSRLPLDLYLAGAATAVFLLIWGAFALVEDVFYGSSSILLVQFALALVLVFVAAVICACYYCALAAQLKLRGGYWWRHCVIGWCLRKIWHTIRWIWRSVKKLFAMMPLVWQWIVVGGSMGLMLVICAAWSFTSYYHSNFPFVLSILIYAAVLGYCAYSFGILYAGAKRMAKGDLSRKVPTKYLFGCFLDFAVQLNALADVAVVAAREQLKSERMKTELITNVSHDIKTPLTSIINYVDLLRKPHSDEEGAQYLEVLSRQSLRMKKLLEDLMEMSKASTGNIQVDIRKVDAVETVNQALGEFADKLASVSLTPVFPQPKKSVYMMADGRLAWRVLSNVLSNAVKYALPGTRLYIDLTTEADKVIISLKNISREQLNISAEELMERFVRGDTARNTEGNGLGLNIAQSLMDLQHGKLQLLVDGDLFKVTLTFPGCR